MDRIFWRIWGTWSAYTRWSTDWSWFTPKAATIFVSSLYVIDWLVILVVGKRRWLAIQAEQTRMPEPPWFKHVHGWTQDQPRLLLAAFVLSALLLWWLFYTGSGRKLRIPYRSTLLAMALAGILGAFTGVAVELWLRL